MGEYDYDLSEPVCFDCHDDGCAKCRRPVTEADLALAEAIGF